MSVKSDLLLSLLAEDGVKLHGSGKNQSGLCPFHEDTNPSFSVAVELGVYICHACGAKGDAVDYLVAKRGISKKAALDRIKGTAPASAPARREKPRLKFVAALPKAASALHVYRYADGAEAFTVARFSTGKPKVIPYTPAHKGKVAGWAMTLKVKSDKRPLYRLPELLATSPTRQVWLVEGEKCADAVARAWPAVAVTTWAGGTNADHLTEFGPLHGRPVVLLADRDAPGRKVMERLGAELAAAGGEVKAWLPEGDDGRDIADVLADSGPKAALAAVRAGVAPFAAPAAPDVDLSAPPEEAPPAIPEVLAGPHFRVLGTAHPGRVVIQLASNEILIFPRASLTQASTLVAIAAQAWWLAHGEASAMTRELCMGIGDLIVREAERQGRIDLGRIIGRGAHREDDETMIWHLGDRLLVGDEEQPIHNTERTIFTEGARVALAPVAACADAVAREAFADAVMQYRWATPDDGRRFLGWLVSALVGGALDWRPHLWLVAPASAGKSWLMENVVSRLMGSLCPKLADVTPAGIARRIGSDSLPVLLEEAEPDRSWLEELVAVARLAAGGDGERVRAHGETGVTIDNPRFSVLIASTKMVRLGDADASRFAMLQLSHQPVDDWPAVKEGILAALRGDAALALRSAIIRATPEIVGMARRTAEEFAHAGVSTRDAFIRGALTAGWCWLSGSHETVARTSPRPDAGFDALDALREIVSIRIRKMSGDDESIADMLLIADPSDADMKRARGVGVRWDDTEGLIIALQHPALEQELRKTRLAKVELGELLRQIDGATLSPGPRRFGAIRSRAISIPPAACAQAGLAVYLDDEATPDSDTGHSSEFL